MKTMETMETGENIYIDQAMRHGGHVFSAYTPYGIRSIDSNYAQRIRNINNEVEKVFRIRREHSTFYSWKGELLESMNYETVYREMNPNDSDNKYLDLRVIWKGGCKRDFLNGDNAPTFINRSSKKENPQTLFYEIMQNPHLHDKIKDNLISNLESYCEN